MWPFGSLDEGYFYSPLGYWTKKKIDSETRQSYTHWRAVNRRVELRLFFTLQPTVHNQTIARRTKETQKKSAASTFVQESAEDEHETSKALTSGSVH